MMLAWKTWEFSSCNKQCMALAGIYWHFRTFFGYLHGTISVIIDNRAKLMIPIDSIRWIPADKGV